MKTHRTILLLQLLLLLFLPLSAQSIISDFPATFFCQDTSGESSISRTEFLSANPGFEFEFYRNRLLLLDTFDILVDGEMDVDISIHRDGSVRNVIIIADTLIPRYYKLKIPISIKNWKFSPLHGVDSLVSFDYHFGFSGVKARRYFTPRPDKPIEIFGKGIGTEYYQYCRRLRPKKILRMMKELRLDSSYAYQEAKTHDRNRKLNNTFQLLLLLGRTVSFHSENRAHREALHDAIELFNRRFDSP